MRRVLVITATMSVLAACARSPKASPVSDAAPPIATPAPPAATTSSPIGTVTIPGTIDRPKAEAIGMAYAQKHWPKLKPSFATAFIMPDGSFKVVIAFDKSPAGASIYVRNTDGEVMDASIAGNH